MVNWLQKAIARYYENSGPITSGHSGFVNKVHRKQNIHFFVRVYISRIKKDTFPIFISSVLSDFPKVHIE